MSLVDDAACPFKSIDDIMVVEDAALKSEGVHVRGGEVCFEDFIRYHPKAVKKGDGAQQPGGKSVISDDILRQLQIMFPWMSKGPIYVFIRLPHGPINTFVCFLIAFITFHLCHLKGL